MNIVDRFISYTKVNTTTNSKAKETTGDEPQVCSIITHDHCFPLRILSARGGDPPHKSEVQPTFQQQL